MIINQKVARICLQGARGYCERVAGGCEIGLMVLLKIRNIFQVCTPYRAAPCWRRLRWRKQNEFR